MQVGNRKILVQNRCKKYRVCHTIRGAPIAIMIDDP